MNNGTIILPDLIPGIGSNKMIGSYVYRNLHAFERYLLEAVDPSGSIHLITQLLDDQTWACHGLSVHYF